MIAFLVRNQIKIAPLGLKNLTLRRSRCKDKAGRVRFFFGPYKNPNTIFRIIVGVVLGPLKKHTVGPDGGALTKEYCEDMVRAAEDACVGVVESMGSQSAAEPRIPTAYGPNL